MKMVTLVTIAPLEPYNEGEVFTVTDAEAKLLLEHKPVKVRLYDAKKDAHLLPGAAERSRDGVEAPKDKEA